LDDPDLLRFYSLVSSALDWAEDDPRVIEAADILDRLLTRAADAGNSTKTVSMTRSPNCSTRQWHSPRPPPGGCSRSSKNAGGRVGPASSAYLPTSANRSRSADRHPLRPRRRHRALTVASCRN